MKEFNITDLCILELHFMVDITHHLQKIQTLYQTNQKGFLTVMCFVVAAAILGRTS